VLRADDEASLTAAVAGLLRDVGRRAAMAGAARDRYRRFEIATVARAYGDAYNALLEERLAG